MAQIKELVELLELGTPLYYAVGIFFLFNFLDNRASPRAHKAIAVWLRSDKYNQVDVSSALVEVFDRIYTSPLWGWRAVLRSATISIIVTSLAIYHVMPVTFYILWAGGPDLTFQFSQQIASNLIADYLSLYVIRTWLRSRIHPLITLIGGPLIGLTIIFAIYTIGDVARFSIETSTFHLRYFPEGLSFWLRRLTWLPQLEQVGASSTTAILIGAIAVHAWLPLFAIGVVVAQALNSIRKAATGLQWFLREGNKHPIQAIGYVAATVTFIVATILQYSLGG